MSNSSSSFFAEFSEAFGAGWNRFWFSPTSPKPLAVLRVLCGIFAFYYLASHSADLNRWFQADGLLPQSSVNQLMSTVSSQFRFPLFHILSFARQPSELLTIHILCLVVVAAFTAGLFTRVTSVLALCAVLSYVHRAPIIAGQFEAVLVALLFYLVFAPCATSFSIDAWRRRRQQVPAPNCEQVETHCWFANTCLRLLQIHVAAFYGIMGLTKLGGVYDLPFEGHWWRGEAIWWLMTRTECRLIDLTGMHDLLPLINACTYAVLLFELLFPVLIWNRWARPIFLLVAIPIWLSLALITGLVSFCLLMLVANFVFISPETLDAACLKLGISRRQVAN